MTNSDSQRATQQTISIVIPVLNEESQIAATLAGLETVAQGQQAELIVADGGSTDRTVDLASRLEAIRIVNCPQANRGWQMNEGAAAARGNILLFLHADVILPPSALSAIRRALVDASILGGCFQLRFPAGATASLRAVAWGINLRTRLFQTATGDQAIFIRRTVFDELGGYETFPLMEDIALFNQLRKRGRVVILNEQVEISPRRWLRFGVWRTVLLMYALRLGYWLGIHPATLKKLFIDVR